MEIKETKEIIDGEMKSLIKWVSYAEEASTYYIEIGSGCNLKCNMCPFGCEDSFCRQKNNMSIELFSQIIEKISKISPKANIGLYHYNEPFLNMNLIEYVNIVKKYNMELEISSNFNFIRKDLLKNIINQIDSIIISVSGYYQEIYSKSHRGGNIEDVKKNMFWLKELIEEKKSKVSVQVSYHMYMDNIGDDYREMQKLVNRCNFKLVPLWSRSINTEMNLKYLREMGYSRYLGEKLEWINDVKLSSYYYDTMNRMLHRPEDFLIGKWENLQGDICPCSNRYLTIHNDGKIELCSCGFDDRLNKFDYLSVDMKHYYLDKKENLLCKECLANNIAFYMNYVDLKQVEKNAYDRLVKRKKEWNICEEVIGKGEEEIIEFARNHAKIYIWGAGEYGENLKKFLENKGIFIESFIVTNKEYVDNKEVICINEFIDTTENGIIIAMKRHFKAQICEKVKEMNCDIIYAAEHICL